MYMHPFEQLGPARKRVTCAHASLACVASVPFSKINKAGGHGAGQEMTTCSQTYPIHTHLEVNNKANVQLTDTVCPEMQVNEKHALYDKCQLKTSFSHGLTLTMY